MINIFFLFFRFPYFIIILLHISVRYCFTFCMLCVKQKSLLFYATYIVVLHSVYFVFFCSVIENGIRGFKCRLCIGLLEHRTSNVYYICMKIAIKIYVFE